MNVIFDSPDVGRFRDRRDAGFQLAWALKDWRGRRLPPRPDRLNGGCDDDTT